MTIVRNPGNGKWYWTVSIWQPRFYCTSCGRVHVSTHS